MTDVSVVIVSYNTKGLLFECLKSVRKYTKGVEYEVVVVDNASTDGSVEELRAKSEKLRVTGKKLKLILNRKNVGFSKANNQGMKVAMGKYILLLNSDTRLNENSLSKMVKWLDGHKDVGVATCRLLNPDGSVQASGGYFPSLLRVFLWATFLDDLPLVKDLVGGAYHDGVSEEERQQDWVSGAFLMMRREMFDKTRGLDEDFFMYAEDVDFCFRVKRLGFQVWYAPGTSVVHVGSASSGGGVVRFQGSSGKERGILGEFRGLKMFYKKHCSLLARVFLFFLVELAAVLRLIVFGILRRQKEALKVYAKALVTS